jgi:hypothetical protein
VAKCVICERSTSGSLEFCQHHYQEHKHDIKTKKPWVRALKNAAQRERRLREKEFANTSLDALQDNFLQRIQ